jgi:rhamnose utilization protein RhaD (predicted bifunctional aldolase and dehydrogenase)
MLALTDACAAFIAANGAALAPPAANRATGDEAALDRLATALRGFDPFTKGVALDLRCNDPVDALLALPDLEEVSGRGTITPDHVIRLKPWPLVGEAGFTVAEWTRRLEDYARAYTAYFDRHAPSAAEPKTMLDPLPRAVLIRGLGVAGIGRDAKEARICADLLDQGARVIVASEKLGRFSPIREDELFEMEYWSLEQAKLKHA